MLLRCTGSAAVSPKKILADFDKLISEQMDNSWLMCAITITVADVPRREFRTTRWTSTSTFVWSQNTWRVFQAKSLRLLSTAQKKYKKDELFKEMMHLQYLPHKSLWIEAIYLGFSQQAVWLQGGKRNYAYVSIKYWWMFSSEERRKPCEVLSICSCEKR